jgi:hypothetical protein
MEPLPHSCGILLLVEQSSERPSCLYLGAADAVLILLLIAEQLSASSLTCLYCSLLSSCGLMPSFIFILLIVEQLRPHAVFYIILLIVEQLQPHAVFYFYTARR